MKKWKIYSIVVTVLLALIVIAVIIVVNRSSSALSEAEVKQIALRYIGINEENVTFTSVHKDLEDREYELRLYDDTYVYEIDIDYGNGKINNFEKDVRKEANIQVDPSVSLTEEEAKEIALQRAGKTSSEVTFTNVHLDSENGITVYDVVFHADGMEYEFSIDVNSREIISYYQEYLRGSGNGLHEGNGNQFIGLTRAREIALAHAGLTNDQVVFHKVELDVDYPVSVYEIEFYYNYLEYDYEINAETGEIISYERGQ